MFFIVCMKLTCSLQILAEKLRYAIFNCTEMDGDFRLDAAAIPGWGGFIRDVTTT